MELSKVRIKNFRSIADQEIVLKPGFNLIKGENGKGKSSILEAIAVGLGGFLAGLNGVSTRHFTLDEVRTDFIQVGDGSYGKKHHVPVEVILTADLYGETYEWTRSKHSIRSSRSTTQPRDICRKAEQMAEEPDTELPVLVYLGAGRVWSQKREKSENVFRKQYFRTVGYTDCLVEASNIKLLLNWCVKMEQIAWQKEKKIAEYEAVKTAVGKFMDCMEKCSGHQVFYDRQEEQLMYKFDEKILPIAQLSAGYQSLIWTVFDIAYRMAVLNPDKRAEIAQTKGIVLIDELDIHLHPRWQWNVIEALREIFPNVQFIAATHAPVLFASAPNVWLINVDNDKIDYGYSHYGIDVNTSMSVYQGTQEIPEEVKKLADEFCQMMDREDYEKAGKILNQLERDTAPAHPLLIELRTRYDFEKAD